MQGLQSTEDRGPPVVTQTQLPSFNDFVQGTQANFLNSAEGLVQLPMRHSPSDSSLRPAASSRKPSFEQRQSSPNSPVYRTDDNHSQAQAYPFSTQTQNFTRDSSLYTGRRSSAIRTASSSSISLASMLNDDKQPTDNGLIQQAQESPGFYTTSTFLLSPQDTEGRARHRLSEKHRRDGQGVFIRCSDILRRGIQTYSCRLCTPPDNEPSATSERTSPTLRAASNAPAAKGKKAKNDQLAEGLIWEFLIILHHCPEELPPRIKHIEALAAQMAREKIRSKDVVMAAAAQGGTSRIRGCDDDVRDLVAEQILRRIEFECARHGIDPKTGKPTHPDATDDWEIRSTSGSSQRSACSTPDSTPPAVEHTMMEEN